MSDSSSLSPAAQLEIGREAARSRQWRAAHERLSRVDDLAELHADDLWLLALSAYMLGRDEEFVTALERSHRELLVARDYPGAVRAAFWIGFNLVDRGQLGPATGWFGRAGRLLEECGHECAERGYLLLASGVRMLAEGNSGGAWSAGEEAARLALRHAERDLLPIAILLQGRARLLDGRIQEGLALLDEAMVAVATDELSPHVTGMVYCGVIGSCRSVYAIRRAQEWTSALTDWCERQPDLVPYSGECLVYRAELMLLRGSWREAVEEARKAVERTGARAGAAAAAALNQQGEAHRLLGELDAADAAFRAASRLGREPQPGLSLLRLARDDVQAAASGIRRALAETGDPLRRARLLPAHVEIMLVAGAPEEARRSVAELEDLVERYHSGVLLAMAAHARGASELAAGDAASALPRLREAAREWQRLEIPYEAARARALVGMACGMLGDAEAAAGELDAAREALNYLGASGEIARIERMLTPVRSTPPHPLTPRERQVLALVAKGGTNRAIAAELHLSEKTVARHLSNIYLKLGISSRAAATAYAYENDLILSST